VSEVRFAWSSVHHERIPGVYTLTEHDVDLIYVSYPEKLLITAQDLIEKGEFSISVVVAHMACEISVERAISRAFKAKGIDYLEQPVEDLLPSYNLNRTTEDWHTNAVTLSVTKGLGMRFFATLRMTRPSGHIVKCTNVMWFDLDNLSN
jgi:hypothetical protein